MDNTRRKGSPHVAQVDSVPEQGHRAPLVPVSELLGTVSGDFAPFWARFWPGPAQTKIISFGPVEAQYRREKRTRGIKGTPEMNI